MTAGAARVAEAERKTSTVATGAAQPATVIPLPTVQRAARMEGVTARASGGGGAAVAGRPGAPGALPSGTRRGAPVVLTRRGRAVVTGVLALLAAGLFLVLPRGADATGAGVSPIRSEQNLSQVAVRPGDTLWSIALRADPSADPRLVVQRITDLNALPGTGITPGQILWVPRN